MALLSLLRQRIQRPLFLPAHGRGAALPLAMRRLLRCRAGWWDLPELPQVGGPLATDGAVAQSQREAAQARGVERCWYGVNGATGLLQAALLAITQPGDAVLMPRNSHRSLIQACLLGQLTPLLFDLPFQADRGQPAPATAAWMDRVLAALPADHPPIGAAVLVHPTYQGYATDPGPLIQRLRMQGWPVLVDEAHGSHFAVELQTCLPPSALQAGADLVVHSLQKSASGLAQTAVMWMQGQRVDPCLVDRSLAWLQTTSPSALLLASCASTLMEWEQARGRRLLDQRLQQARQLAEDLRHDGLPLLHTQDPLRLVLHTGAAGISGLEADEWMLKRDLIAELPEPATLTFCLGLAAHKGLRQLMRQRWFELLQDHADRSPQPAFEPPPLPLVAAPEMPLGQAWRAKQQRIRLDQAEGLHAAEPVCPYPPGIPLLIPGEQLDPLRLRWLLSQRQLWGDQISETVACVAEIA